MAKTTAELVEQAQRAEVVAREAQDLAARLQRATKDAQRREQADLRRATEAAHYERLYDEIGRPLAGLNEAQHAIVYEQAWDHGHSSGYEEVESYYGDFAEMARKLLDVA